MPKKGQVEKYGAFWSADTSMIAIVLWGYRTSRGPEHGWLGREKHFRNAFKLMWPKFPMHLWMDMLIQSFCNETHSIVLGHTRASKTYGSSHIAYLDYCADPLGTWTSLTTVTFDGLRSRMWADMITAIETASIKSPFKLISNSNEMKLFLDNKESLKDRKYMIEGFATSKTADSAERIQGKHADRRRLFLDEAEGLPEAIYHAETNAASAADFRSMKLANPLDRLSMFGQQYEPEGGWGSITADDLWWRAKTGFAVLHFDGLQCHNMKLYNELTQEEYDKKKFKWMITAEYIEGIRKGYGEDSPEWWKFVRGFPPPDGSVARVFPAVVMERMKKTIEYDLPPEKFCLCDPAFEHDDCVLQFGEYGKLRDGRIAIQFTESQRVPIKTGIKIDPKDYQIKDYIMAECITKGVKPSNFIQDKTGNGRGVFALLQMEWSKDVQGVEFGGAPTERPVRIYDEDTPKDLYCYFVDELWFRTKAWGEEGLIGGLDNLAGETQIDLGSRMYSLRGTKQRLMSKEDMKKITGRSPDFGDAFILIGELLARKGIYVGEEKLPEIEDQSHMYDDPMPTNHWQQTKKRAQGWSDVIDDESYDH